MAGPLRKPRSALLAGCGLLLGFLLFEAGLRLCAPLLPPALRIFVRDQAYRDAVGALRVAKGSMLLLRESDFQEGAGLLLLGDSFTFGASVAKEDTFSVRLGRMTGKKDLNLGVSASGPEEYNRMLQWGLERLPSAPPLILYVLALNDFTYRTRGGEPLFIWETEYRRRAKLRLRWIREWLFQRSVTYQIAKRLLTGKRLLPAAPYRPAYLREDAGEFFFAPPSFLKPLLAQPSLALEKTSKKILAAKELSEEAGSRFLLVLMPFQEQVHLPALIADGKMPAELYDPSYDSSYDRIKTLAEEAGVRCLDLRPAFREAARRGKRPFLTMDSHLSEEGHRLTAELLAAALQENG